MEYKIGDKVLVIKSRKLEILNKIALVIDITDYNLCLQFSEHIDGHGNDRKNWWVDYHTVKLLDLEIFNELGD